MSTENYKAIVRRIVEEGFNQRNFALFDEVNAPDFVHHDPDTPDVRNSADYKQWVINNNNAFPDFHLTIDDLFSEGDRVVTRWTFHGTNTGDIVTPMPLPATGKQVTVSGVTISRFAGEKLAEDWHLADTIAFMQQLGVIPAPEQVA